MSLFSFMPSCRISNTQSSFLAKIFLSLRATHISPCSVIVKSFILMVRFLFAMIISLKDAGLAFRQTELVSFLQAAQFCLL